MTVAVTQSPNAGGPNTNSFPGDVEAGGNIRAVGYLDATTIKLNGTSIGAALAATGAVMNIGLNDARVIAAWKDGIADTPGSSLLGLTDTEGAPLVGNAASGNTKTDKALFTFSLPGWYVAGSAITVRLRARTTALSTVSDKVDVDSFKILTDGTLGSDLCATASQQMTASVAAYSFTITPTGLVAGMRVHLVVATILIDTGGTIGGIGEIYKVDILLG